MQSVPRIWFVICFRTLHKLKDLKKKIQNVSREAMKTDLVVERDGRLVLLEWFNRCLLDLFQNYSRNVKNLVITVVD